MQEKNTNEHLTWATNQHVDNQTIFNIEHKRFRFSSFNDNVKKLNKRTSIRFPLETT